MKVRVLGCSGAIAKDCRTTSFLIDRDVLVTGGESVTVDEQGQAQEYHNSVFALGSDGSLLWRYDKAHLVPFGEYLPLRPLLERIGLSRLVPGEGDFSRGPGPRSFEPGSLLTARVPGGQRRRASPPGGGGPSGYRPPEPSATSCGPAQSGELCARPPSRVGGRQRISSARCVVSKQPTSANLPICADCPAPRSLGSRRGRCS